MHENAAEYRLRSGRWTVFDVLSSCHDSDAVAASEKLKITVETHLFVSFRYTKGQSVTWSTER